MLGVGELLWDLLPTGPQLGGAPANVAFHVSQLGDKGTPCSRVGCDTRGEAAVAAVKDIGMSSSGIQRDPQKSTGTVDVTVDDKGQPTYTIHEGVAWDAMEVTDTWLQLARRADAACFGSLAQRSRISQSTLYCMLNNLPKKALRVFDVNLRQDFYSATMLWQSLQLATIVKVNHEELPIVIRLLELPGDSLGTQGRVLLEKFALDLVCITRGGQGSVLLGRSEEDDHPGNPAEVTDAVGAGDAFSATLIHHRLRGASLRRINEAANYYAAWVTSHPGATPSITPEIRLRVTDVPRESH